MAIGTVSSGNLRDKLEGEQRRIKEVTGWEGEVAGNVADAQQTVLAIAAALAKVRDLAHPLRKGTQTALGLHANVAKTTKSVAGSVAELVNDTNRRDVGATAEKLGGLAVATREQRGQLADVDKTTAEFVTRLDELAGLFGDKFIDGLGVLATALGERGNVGRFEEVNNDMDGYIPGL